jgi:hydrogenase 3 maturation protease
LNPLAQTLAHLRRPDRPPRVAVVGMGHELRGDDAAGVAVARTLQSCLPRFNGFRESGAFIVIDAGPAVENCTGLLRRFGPDLVLLIDAAQMDDTPGAVRWLAWEETDGLSASTHTLPPRVLAQYLTSELGCEVALVGIQPADTTMGAPLSPPVQASVQSVAQALAEMLEDLTPEK